MNSKGFLFISLVAVVGFAGAGCSNDGKKSTEVVPNDIAGYSRASCLYGYSEGPAALDLRGESVQTKQFGKRIDMNLLNAIMASSGSELVRAAENTGVRFYKTTTAKRSDSCEYASSLPDAPLDVDNAFTKAGKGVLGVFLSKGIKDLYSTDSTAVIAVRKDVNKWVLVHEYMHHLFNKEVERTGSSANDIKEKTIKLLNDYESKKRSLEYSYGTGREALAKEVAELLVQTNASMIAFLKQYYLEEMTIESILAEKLATQELKMVLAEQRLNGAAYIVVSEKKASKLIDELKEETSKFVSSHSSKLTSDVYSKLVKSAREYNLIQTEAKPLSDKAMQVLRENNLEDKLDLSGISAGAGAVAAGHTHGGCSHDKDADEILEIVSDIKNQ